MFVPLPEPFRRRSAVISLSSDAKICMRIHYFLASFLVTVLCASWAFTRVGNWLAVAASGDVRGVSCDRISFVALALVRVGCLFAFVCLVAAVALVRYLHGLMASRCGGGSPGDPSDKDGV